MNGEDDLEQALGRLLPMHVGGWEFTTYRTSRTSPNPGAVERFVAVDVDAERAWTAYAQAVRLPMEEPQEGRLTRREQMKLVYLSAWHAHELLQARDEAALDRARNLAAWLESAGAQLAQTVAACWTEDTPDRRAEVTKAVIRWDRGEG